MQSINLSFYTHIVPKKNAFRAGVSKSGKPYQYLKKIAKVSQAKLREEARLQVARAGFCQTRKTVEIRAIFKRTTGDCIGLAETLFDALEGVVYKNDRQVGSSVIRWDFNGILFKNETCRVQCLELDTQ